MSVNERHMAASTFLSENDTKRSRDNTASGSAGATLLEIANLKKSFNIYKRDAENELESIRRELSRVGSGSTSGNPAEPGKPGKDGVGITKVEQTIVSEESGGNNEIKITLSNDASYTFSVRNGKEGVPGKSFTYEDFTPEQLETLKGEHGDPFTYDDFTPEQLAALKGAPGKTPVRGEDYWTPDDIALIKSYIGEYIDDYIINGEW